MEKNCIKVSREFLCSILRNKSLRGLLVLAGFLIIQSFTSQLYAQSRVTGVVTDIKGEPLPGVSVKVKGTNNGVATTPDGKYNISVSDSKAVLVFTYIGFVTQEEPVNNRSVINVKLKENATDLNEVVVTGYGGAVAKKDLTGAISTVSAKQINERQPVTLFDALQGQVSGAMIINDNGDPAGEGTIQIRGASTINASGTGPLYVIDGVISDNANFVSPNDIQSIEVLKDGSSTAIYGARGANGVILITTKRGEPGKPRINATYTHTLGELAHKLRTTSSADLRYYRFAKGGGNGGGVADSVNPYMNKDNDYQDLMYRTAHKQVASLSISGGQKGITYYTGLNYTDDRSIIINSWIKRVQAKANVDFQVTPKVKFTNNITFQYQTGNSVPLGNSAKQVFERNPWTSIYLPDGSLAGYVESKRNPVAYAMYTIDKDNNYVAQYNAQLDYQIIKDLKFTNSFNIKVDNNRNIGFSPKSLTSGANGDASGSNTHETDVRWEFQSYLNYNRTFAKNHNVTAMFGFSADRRRYDKYYIAMSKYLNETIYTSNAAQLIDLTKTGTSGTANADASLFGRLGYNYKSRYILEGSFRRDGSSRFGYNNIYGNFFAGSAAWRFTDENFMLWSKSFLNDGKLRFSVGQAGNDAIGDYGSYTLINFGDNFYNGNSTAALGTTMGNPNIKWETTTSQDLGLELNFLKGRLIFSADAYKKLTTNLLYDQTLPPETGYTKTNINLGSIENKGIEFELGGTPISNKDFQWDINGNITFQSGHIKKLADNVSFVSGDKWLIREGGEIGDMYVWKNEGIYRWDVSNAYSDDWQRLEPIDVSADGRTAGGYTLNGQPYTGDVHSLYRNGLKLKGGNVIWQNTQRDSVIDDNDRVIAGNGVPNYYFGFVNTFRYKNFSLNVLLNGNLGYQVYNRVAANQNQFSSTYSPPIYTAIYNSWQKQGDIATYPYFPNKNTYGDMSPGQNSLYIENGSFIRLSSARLSYSLDKKFTDRIKVQGVNIYIFGTNLLTWTNYSWYDPEFSSNGLNIGEDNGKYPKRREIGLGLNVNF